MQNIGYLYVQSEKFPSTFILAELKGSFQGFLSFGVSDPQNPSKSSGLNLMCPFLPIEIAIQ